MSLAIDNIDVLRHGWEDAVSTVTPDLPDVRATMEDAFARAVADSLLDEQSLLDAVRDIVSVASRSGGADNARLLSKQLHRSVYEYLLSLDALTAEETEVVDRPLGGSADPSLLIGFEEVAELEQRQSALADVTQPDAADDPAPAEPIYETQPGEAPLDHVVTDDDAATEPPDEAATSQPAVPDVAEPHGNGHYRPRFRLFHRGDRHGDGAGAEPSGIAPPEFDARETEVPAPAPPPPPVAPPPPPAPTPEWWRGPAVPAAPEPAAADAATVAPLAEAMAEIVGDSDDAFDGDEVAWTPSRDEAPATATPAQPDTPAEPEPTAVPEPLSDDPPAAWRVRERPSPATDANPGWLMPSERPEPEPPSDEGDAGMVFSPAADVEVDPVAAAAGDVPSLPADEPSWLDERPSIEAPAAGGGLGALEAWATGAHPLDAGSGSGAIFVTEPPASNGYAYDDSGFTVAPREGFHLTEDEDFITDGAEAETPASAPPAPEAPQLPQQPPQAGAGADADDERKPWHVRRSPRQAPEIPPEMDADALADLLDGEDDDQDELLDRNPLVADARDEINDRLRRRRCDEAASLLQRLASEVGGRSVAELALDAGDRCRALGKANAALSCYIAASRADPVFEQPLLRLADICLDDRDVDLAVSYLDRVARLHRMRGDTRGALRIYRKIATIAPYRDDILATLMRANSTGQFED